MNTDNQLPAETLSRLEADAQKYTESFRGSIYNNSLGIINAAYHAGLTAEALRYQYLLRFAGVPELIIANPDFIKEENQLMKI
jgi:hypothetical protein